MRRRFTDYVATTVMVAFVPVLVFIMAGTALAARPSPATLSVSPNHAAAWSSATGYGCGYSAPEVYIDIQKPEAFAFLSVAPDPNGCIAFVFNTDGPGTYLIETRQAGNGKHWRTMASYWLPVE